MVTIAPPSTIWYEWADPLGQIFRPGDYVVYAGMSGKSSTVTIGRVDRINRYKADGTEILTIGEWDQATRTRLPGKPSATVRIIPLQKHEGKWTDRKVLHNPQTRRYEETTQPQSPKTLQNINHVFKLEWTP